MTARRRPRLRSKGLVVDSSTSLDLTSADPPVKLQTAGRQMWEQLTADPPFWWSEADVPMVGMLCAATDAVASAMRTGSPAGRAAILKEWRSIADQLGMSPTSRSRIKLTEGQAVVAAQRAQAMADAGQVEPEAPVLDVDELVGEHGK